MFTNYVGQILHIIDHLPTSYPIGIYYYKGKYLYVVDISSTTYLPRLVNVVKECPLAYFQSCYNEFIMEKEENVKLPLGSYLGLHF